MGILIACGLLAIQGEPPTIDVQQFVSVVEAKVEPLKDLAFLYEGTWRWVGPRSVLGKDPGTFGGDFQGAYLYRKNDAAMMDAYHKAQADPARMSRVKVAYLHPKTEKWTIPAEDKGQARRRPEIHEDGGGFWSFQGPASPNVLFSTWRLLWMARQNADDFRVIGWEEVDGRTCLRFRTGSQDENDPKASYVDHWIDLERSANVLRYEYRMGGNLISRTDDVAVQRIELPGGEPVWVAVGARLRSYRWNDVFYSEPVHEELFSVVEGTILLNQGLPDEIFNVRRASGLPQPGELARLQRRASEFRLKQEYEKIPEREPFRLDPAGARENLERNLAEAEKQAKMLEASAPSREPWTATTAIQLVALLAGIGLFVGAFVLRRRSG